MQPSLGVVAADDLGADAAEEWSGNPSLVPTQMDAPAQSTTLALLKEIQRSTAATMLLVRAVSRFTVAIAVISLAVIGCLAAIAAALLG